MSRTLAACALALLAATALAQTPAPEAKSEEPPKKPPLNLRLDDAGRYARDPAPATGPASNLPSLGDGTKTPPADLRRPSKDPIPKDTAPDKQM